GRGAKAVFQFYPGHLLSLSLLLSDAENPSQMEIITNAAMRCGFSGGLVVDYPNSTKAKKYFLCLFAGTPSTSYQLPKAIGEDIVDEPQQTVKYSNERKNHKKRTKDQKREPVKSKVCYSHMPPTEFNVM